MRTLEYLVTGHYRQAAKLVRDTDADAALVFYLTKADPLLVLRDLARSLHVLRRKSTSAAWTPPGSTGTHTRAPGPQPA